LNKPTESETNMSTKDNIVTLNTPITRGEQKIEKITMRKPMSGELRGANLTDLLQMDVNALHKVLPRITDPMLTEAEVAALDPADLVQCGAMVMGFLLSKGKTSTEFPQE
jgi:hypothetical protein